MSKEYERDPRFPDGVGVISDDGERARIVDFDPSDEGYLVLRLPGARWHSTEWWYRAEKPFQVDPDPAPWPGEGRVPPGVLLYAPVGDIEGLEVFASIEELIADRTDEEAKTLKDLALRAVAEPDTWMENINSTAVVCYQLLEGGDPNARERRAGAREASP